MNIEKSYAKHILSSYSKESLELKYEIRHIEMGNVIRSPVNFWDVSHGRNKCCQGASDTDGFGRRLVLLPMHHKFLPLGGTPAP